MFSAKEDLPRDGDTWFNLYPSQLDIATIVNRACLRFGLHSTQEAVDRLTIEYIDSCTPHYRIELTY